MKTHQKRGLLVTIEGTEGVGKTTNIDFAKAWLAAQNIDVTTTREPGGTPFAEQIRELLLAPRDEPVAPLAELLMMFAGRAQHLHRLIEPTLSAGGWVICDRFTDASYAYQGAGRGIDPQLIEQLEAIVQQGLQPDLTLILDIPVAEGLKRASARSEPDRFEREQVAFFERVRGCYLERAEREPLRCVVIDASQSITAVQAQLDRALTAFLQRSEQ